MDSFLCFETLSNLIYTEYEMAREHNSITTDLAIQDAPYDVKYELEGYLPEEFPIEVTSKQPQTHHKKLLLFPRGGITLSADSIPEEVVLDVWAPFHFIITNTSMGNAQYALQMVFEGVGIPNRYELPESEEDLIWSETVEPNGSVDEEFVIKLPEEAIPAGKDEANYDIFLKLFGWEV